MRLNLIDSCGNLKTRGGQIASRFALNNSKIKFEDADYFAG